MHMLMRGSSFVVCLGLLSSGAVLAQQYTIATLAGNGTDGFLDGSDLKSVQFSSPTALALDAAGNLYIADTLNSLIRRVTKDGNIASFVGGTGPTAGRLKNPTGIWVDASGTLYIADTGNRRIAKFANGNLTNFAGN